jgi:ADP-ribosyl-[dinitrogen reductase] hydrolase
MYQERALGCILGGAIGDAVGAPVEFDRSPQISDMLPWHGRPAGNWTDDTEMTIATAQAIIAWEQGGIPLRTALWDAYRRWRRTCDRGRAPGMTCLSATAQPEPGTVAAPLNDSKGCGGVMRVAPLGIAFSDREQAFQLGIEAAAMTHGHPMGYLPAGFLTTWVSGLIDGEPLDDAFLAAVDLTHARQPNHGGRLTVQLIEARRAIP